LGTQADPTFLTAANLDSLNDEPEQAYKWYGMKNKIDSQCLKLQSLADWLL
jgi:hypothetical protein